MQANQQRVDSIKSAVQARVDSMRQERDRIMDSIMTLRDRRRDSLQAIADYRNSRHFKDSVEQARQAFKDSLNQVRLQTLDSIKTDRMRYTDSLKLARETMRDSIQTTIQARRDSLQKAKEERIAAREKAKGEGEKMTKEERQKAARDQKHKEAKEAYDNTKFLKKRWRFPRNALQNTYTRYNYYYNANMMFYDLLDRVYQLQKTDFDSIIDVYRVSPQNAKKYGGSTQDEIIKKASLDIQMHDPRSKWQDDLYYLIAKSYFYKDDFDNSIPYTKFVISQFKDFGKDNKDARKKKKGRSRRNKPTDIVEKVSDEKGKKVRVLSICTKEPKGFMARFKHRPIHNDAIMLLIRTYATEGYHTEALSLLHQVTEDIHFPERLKPEADRLLTQIYIQEDDYKKANEYLKNAIATTKKKKDRNRLYFLQGQIFQEYQQLDSAYYYYDRVANSNADLDVSVHASIKKAEIVYKNNWTQKSPTLDREFKRMLRQDKYSPFFGQIHFNKGLMALMDNNLQEAEEEFTLSIEQNTDDFSKAKALDELTEFYYQDGQYTKSSKYLKQLQEMDLKAIGFSSKADYADYTYILPTMADKEVEWLHADSMLYLSTLTPNQQEKWAKAEYKKANIDTSSGFQKMTPTNASPKTSGSNFYFANSKLQSEGMTKFQKTWGEIANEDNWGIKSLITNSGNLPVATLPNTSSTTTQSTAEGYQKYLTMIPQTPEQKEALNLQIEQAIYDLGNISFRQLNDPDRATAYFDTLLKMYPNTSLKPEVLFGEYLIAEKRGDQQSARDYKNLLQGQFPGSYSKLFDEYNQTSRLAAQDTAAQRYRQLYDLFSTADYPATSNYYTASIPYFKDFKEYQDKSKLLYAQAEMGQGNYPVALKQVDEIITSNPADDVKSFAQDLMQVIQMQMGLEVQVDTPGKPEKPKMEYNFDENEKTQLIMEIADNEVVNEVKIAFSDFNKQYFATSNLKVSEKILPNKKRVVAIYNFDNFQEAMKYKKEMLLQWDSDLNLNPQDQSSIIFINPRNLGFILTPGAYEGYVEFFQSKY